MTWILVWKITLILGVVLFAGLTAWVTVRGWRDLRALLEKLRAKGRP
jgi:hypothetical protein